MENNIRLLLVGSARSGKDSCAEILRDTFGLQFKSSSMAAAEIFLYDALKDKYGYKSFEECFEDRVNHRAEWHDLIVEYNTPDKARLAKEILKTSSVYAGMRSGEEIEECLRQGLFDLIVWIDASDRVPMEGKESFNIDKSYADIIIDNNGTKEQFENRVLRTFKLIL